MTQTGNVVTTLVYDGDGLRRKKQTASDITKFIWDDQDVLIETNDAGTTQVNYTQTPDTYGSLVSQRRSGTSKFYSYDALGSTSELTNFSQTQTDSYRYYAFGKSLTSTGSTANPYQFVGNLGYYNEGSLSIQYLRARWYSPNTGRFISEDPLLTHDQDANMGGVLELGVRFYHAGIGRFGQVAPVSDASIARYIYCNSNPTERVDPSGLITLDPSNSTNWWQRRGMPDSHCPADVLAGGLCILRATGDAEAATGRNFKGRGLHNGWGDMFRHCLWACLVYKRCGRGAYNSGVIDHEVDGASWARGTGWNKVEGPMDIANDELGRKIAITGKDYEAGCMQHVRSGTGYVLLPRI